MATTAMTAMTTPTGASGSPGRCLGFVLDLSYNDTNNANFLGKDIADERVVFSVSRTF